MNTNINRSWNTALSEEFSKPYFNSLKQFVDEQYAQETCFPKEKDIFQAFTACNLEDVKVVIIGQDPYHGENQAHGLCYSVNKGVTIPPSLKNIFKELTNDLSIAEPKNGYLKPWADQGVLMLNAVLTVKEKQAGSHAKKGWETFTDAVISIVNNKPEPVTFLLWGHYAKKKEKLITSKHHFVLKTGHPSPLSANRGLWFGNKHFSSTNKILINQGLKPINWSLIADS
ncbi:MAG: uracil-DNA glycosylase [Bacteroidetes bacterium MedPE-SWsnd-G2]|nr:MAG: uracil-DNA glycosylase [Bacteroidetes bacterium MedPE-SWsnd-G2]